jgi:acyl-CoA thioesterase
VAALDDALALDPDGPDRWRGRAHPDHESINGMFGGWTAAVLLGAVVRSASDERRPSALTVNYLASVVPGSDVVVDVACRGSSRSIEHWQADLCSVGGDLAATAFVVMTTRRETDEHVECAMPSVEDPGSLTEFHAPGSQGQQTVMLVPPSVAEYGRGDTNTYHWIRTTDPRPLDHLQLAYLADQQAPRSFYFPGAGPRLSATLTLSVYFHAVDDELAAVGTDPILNESVGTRGVRSTAGQQSRLWSGSGQLLATTEQLCWYR